MKKIIIFVMACVVLCVLSGCVKIEIPANVPEKDDTPAKVETIVPDTPAPPAVVENIENPPDPSPAPAQPEAPAAPSGKLSGMLTAYEAILNELYESYEDPERFRYEDGPAFALFDVDQDGLEELILKDSVGEVSGTFLRIYGYDETGRKAYLELDVSPDFYYYDNGVIEVAWSHNQGAAGDKLWPYSVYQYSDRTKDYAYLAGVDGWDKNLREVFDGQSFPDALDLDGDGFLYYVITEPGGYAPAYGEAMDYDAYEAWRQTYLQGAEPSGIPFIPLVKDNISLQ